MQDAELTAITALNWLINEPELMGRFLSLTGLTADTMREAASEPGFLGGVLAFLMNHEPTLTQFCSHSDIRPEDVSRAWKELGGNSPFETSL